ncbi:MAG: hypothetical protein ACTSU0_03385 [Alphaproteobacteria bacterium]
MRTPFQNVFADADQLIILVDDLDRADRAPAFGIDLSNFVNARDRVAKKNGFRNRIRS